MKKDNRKRKGPVVRACAYCHRIEELCRSHAIPDAVFRAISRKNNGSLIVVPEGSRRVHLTTDTGAAYLLCRTCEKDFNRRFDAPLVNALKALDRKILTHGFGSRIAFSTDQFAQCIASVFWRGCLSPALLYSKIDLSKEYQAVLRNIMDASSDDALRLCSVRITRLYDPTLSKGKGIDQGKISDFILVPNSYFVRKNNKSFYGIGFDVVLFGFLIHMIAPRLPYRLNRRADYLTRGGEEIHAPVKSLFNYPPILDMGVQAMQRSKMGEVTGAVRKLDQEKRRVKIDN